jgi:hypothetical protein
VTDQRLEAHARRFMIPGEMPRIRHLI